MVQWDDDAIHNRPYPIDEVTVASRIVVLMTTFVHWTEDVARKEWDRIWGEVKVWREYKDRCRDGGVG